MSWAGPDGDPTTVLDNDWRLRTTDPRITEGGKDTTLRTCGALEETLSCGGSTVDAAGAPRTVPISIGAYER